VIPAGWNNVGASVVSDFSLVYCRSIYLQQTRASAPPLSSWIRPRLAQVPTPWVTHVARHPSGIFHHHSHGTVRLRHAGGQTYTSTALHDDMSRHNLFETTSLSCAATLHGQCRTLGPPFLQKVELLRTRPQRMAGCTPRTGMSLSPMSRVMNLQTFTAPEFCKVAPTAPGSFKVQLSLCAERRPRRTHTQQTHLSLRPHAQRSTDASLGSKTYKAM
jgi:hypothetical protein